MPAESPRARCPRRARRRSRSGDAGGLHDHELERRAEHRPPPRQRRRPGRPGRHPTPSIARTEPYRPGRARCGLGRRAVRRHSAARRIHGPTPTLRPARRAHCTSADTSELLPTPGGPVIHALAALRGAVPSARRSSTMRASAAGLRSSTSEMARATAAGSCASRALPAGARRAVFSRVRLPHESDEIVQDTADLVVPSACTRRARPLAGARSRSTSGMMPPADDRQLAEALLFERASTSRTRSRCAPLSTLKPTKCTPSSAAARASCCGVARIPSYTTSKPASRARKAICSAPLE